MKKMNKVLAGILTGVLSLTLATTALADSGKKMHVDVIAKGFQNQFWKAVALGSDNAAKELGIDVTFQGPNTDTDIAQQLEYINAAIANKPAAICLATIDTNAALGALEQARDENIPIIGFDSGVPDAPEGSIKANASTDNTAAGALVAQQLYPLVDKQIAKATKPVRIAVVTVSWNSESVKSRTIGFIEQMKKLVGEDNVSLEGYEAIKAVKDGAKVIIEVGVPAEAKDVDAAAVASALLEKDDLIAIFGSNEFTSNAIITANEGLDKIGKDKVTAVGFDAGKKLLGAVRSGLFAGAVTQDPVQIGYQAVKLAYQAANGKAVKDVDTGAKWYNADNMDDEDIKPCLYE